MDEWRDPVLRAKCLVALSGQNFVSPGGQFWMSFDKNLLLRCSSMRLGPGMGNLD